MIEQYTGIIDAAIREAYRHGYRILPNSFHDPKKRSLCPIGAVMVFGCISTLDHDFCVQFIKGFDGDSPVYHKSREKRELGVVAHKLGTRYRKYYTREKGTHV